MKTAEEWAKERQDIPTCTCKCCIVLYNEKVKEIRAYQADAMREASKIAVEQGKIAYMEDKQDKVVVLIRDAIEARAKEVEEGK